MPKGNVLLIVLLLVLVTAVSGYYLYSKGYFGSKTQPQSQASVFDYGSTPLTTSSASSTTVGSQEAGNVSSNKISLSITSPANGTTLASTSTTVTGKTSPNAEVFVNETATQADANGNFSVKLDLDEGQNGLAVTANDDQGNVAEQDLSVNVQSF